jgi:NAD(P)-dependent dehydrogenase (short-subunit alcohol dehydrogenase family)
MSRVAIVTGSDSGIGKATAVRLAADGFDVGITWHTDREGAEGAAAEVRAAGRRAEVRQLDLERLPEAADIVDELADALGGLDVLVNNAGTGASAPFLEHETGAGCCPSTSTARSSAPSGRPAGWRPTAGVGAS